MSDVNFDSSHKIPVFRFPFSLQTNRNECDQIETNRENKKQNDTNYNDQNTTTTTTPAKKNQIFFKKQKKVFENRMDKCHFKFDFIFVRKKYEVKQQRIQDVAENTTFKQTERMIHPT